MILTAMNNKTPKAIKGYWSHGRFVKPEEIALEEDAAQHIVACLAFQDDSVNTCFVEQLPQQIPGRAAAHNYYLSAHCVSFVLF